MSRESFLVLAVTTCAFLLFGEVHGAPTLNNKSILQTIKTDSNICPTRDVFIESRYAKSCNEIKFPLNLTSLDVNNADTYLCLGVYDKISTVCDISHMNGVSVETSKAVPENANVLDERIEMTYPENSTSVETFCKQWTPYRPPKEIVKMRAKDLEKVVESSSGCILICGRLQLPKLKPLCRLLAFMDDISNKLNTIGEKSKVLESEQARDASLNTKSPTDAERAKSIENNKKKKEETKLGEEHEKKENNNSTSAVSIATKIDTNVSSQGTPAAAKVQVVDGKDKPRLAAPNPVESNVSTQAEKTLAQSTQKADNQTPMNNEAIASQESMEKKNDLEKDPNLNQDPSITDPNSDVISQNTRDEEIPGGGEDVDIGNELEPPLIPSSNEEMKQSPALPSEKLGYGSRIPGMQNSDDSHFFGYFTVIGVIFIAGYVGYHNKQKILAMVLEGRRSRGGRSRRRPSTANYRKLDCTLEEAVTSQCNSNVTHVIY